MTFLFISIIIFDDNTLFTHRCIECSKPNQIMKIPSTLLGRILTLAYTTLVPPFIFMPYRFECAKITSKKVIDGKYHLKICTGGNNRTSVEVPEDVYEKHHVHSRIKVKIRVSRHNPERKRATLA